MTKILKHAGFEYDLQKLIDIKGQGIVIKTDSEHCYSDSGTIVSADVSTPFVMKQGNMFLMLVDSAGSRSVRNFQVILISKHVLKKARIVPPSEPAYAMPQGSFRQNSPWILSSESARSQIRQ